jgi:hypothetical protein
MASLAITTVFAEDNTRRGTGMYCNAVREARIVDGDGMCMESESELWTEELGDLDRDRERSSRGKYPSSSPVPPSSPGSVITIMSMFCDTAVRKTAVCGIRSAPAKNKRVRGPTVPRFLIPLDAHKAWVPAKPWKSPDVVELPRSDQEETKGAASVITGGRRLMGLAVVGRYREALSGAAVDQWF